jgi:hypothetical protein
MVEPPASPMEAAALEKDVGFPYRTAIGEILLAYVTCRLDIGFSIAELSKFNAAPAACHYAAAERVFCYLRESMTMASSSGAECHTPPYRMCLLPSALWTRPIFSYPTPKRWTNW